MSEGQEETEEVNDGSNSSRVSCNLPSGVSGESSDEARVECPVISEVEKETEEVNGFWMTGKFARQDLQMLL